MTEAQRRRGQGSRDPMMTWLKFMLVLIVVLKPAYGYTDPGTGIMIYQILAAAFVSALFYVRKFLFFFRKKKD